MKYATTASSLPQCSRRASIDRNSTLSFSRPLYVPGNLWNLNLPTVSAVPGPMGSFTRHVTTMYSPNNPSYVTTAKRPVHHIMELRADPSLENIAAHQAYLEKLQFEQNTLRLWSNMIQDQIMGEAHQVPDQIVKMALTMQQQQSAHPWAQEWAGRPAQPPTAPLPRPVQPTAQPLPVQDCNQTSTCSQQAQPASSSMCGAPLSALFPPRSCVSKVPCLVSKQCCQSSSVTTSQGLFALISPNFALSCASFALVCR